MVPAEASEATAGLRLVPAVLSPAKRKDDPGGSDPEKNNMEENRTHQVKRCKVQPLPAQEKCSHKSPMLGLFNAQCYHKKKKKKKR